MGALTVRTFSGLGLEDAGVVGAEDLLGSRVRGDGLVGVVAGKQDLLEGTLLKATLRAELIKFVHTRVDELVVASLDGALARLERAVLRVCLPSSNISNSGLDIITRVGHGASHEGDCQKGNGGEIASHF